MHTPCLSQPEQDREMDDMCEWGSTHVRDNVVQLHRRHELEQHVQPERPLYAEIDQDMRNDWWVEDLYQIALFIFTFLVLAPVVLRAKGMDWQTALMLLGMAK